MIKNLKTALPAEDAARPSAGMDYPPEPQPAPGGEYDLVRRVYPWGAAYSHILLKGAQETDGFAVRVWRYDRHGHLLDAGRRKVVSACRSDVGVTLELEIKPAEALASPYYSDPDSPMGQHKSWAACRYLIEHTPGGKYWNVPCDESAPDEDGFRAGYFTDAEKPLPYACYAPPPDGKKHPLIVWLHGAGSGGTNVRFVTCGMQVTNLITEDTQKIFGGAHVLAPQCDTFWMSDGTDAPFDATPENIYAPSVLKLIDRYIDDHDDIDKSRVYLFGCSNGGYLTIDLMLRRPGFFAAGVPVCEAYTDAWIDDGQLLTLADAPLWFVCCKNDPVVPADKCTVATVNRLHVIGARDVRLSLYDAIRDPDRDFAYGGHFAWVPALRNACRSDEDGATLFEWMAAQRIRT